MTTILWKIPGTSVSSRGADAFPLDGQLVVSKDTGMIPVQASVLARNVGNRGIDEMSPETAKPRMFGIPDS